MAIAQDIQAAFEAGDIGRVNSLLSQYGVSENQAASLFKLDPAQLAYVKNSGVSFYTPPEDPIIVAPPPAAKISAPTSGRVLEDTDEASLEQQIASAPIQYSYSEVDKKNPAIVREISYLTGEVLDTHILAGGGSQGLAKAAMPVIGMALNVIVPGLGAVVGSALGTSAAVGSAVIQAGLNVAGGAKLEDAIKGLALSQLGGFATESLNTAIGPISDNPLVNKVVSSVASSVINSTLTGQPLTNVVNTIVGSVVNTTVTEQTGSTALGAAAATLAVTGSLDRTVSTLVNNGINGINNVAQATNAIVQQIGSTGLVNNSSAASFADANTADDTDTQISNQLTQSLTFDGSGAADINAAATAAQNAGLDKFTFGGGTYTLDNNNASATIADLERIVAADNLAATTAANLAGGEFAGVDAAVAANTRANNVVIGNAEADNLDQAAYLAKLRNPTGTTFTFDGNTYSMGTSNADVNAALATTRRDTALQDIQNAPNFSDAYSSARSLLGPNQTFTWNGKQYSTATATERPDLNITAADQAIAALNASNLATTTNASGTVAAQNDTLARIIAGGPDQSSAETNRLRIKNEELDLANAAQKATAAQAAIESVFGKGTAANVVIQGLSNIQQASGQTLDFIGGTGAALGLTKADNVLTNAGQSMTRTGEKMQLESVNEANANVINAVNNAQGLGAKIIAGAKAIYQNPLSINMAAIEILQEALPMGLALKSVKLLGKLGAVGLDMGLNAIESGGAAYNDKYRDAIKAGKTVEQADAEGMSAFYIASAVTVATAGVVDTAVINKITKSVEKAASKTATGITKEGGSEFGEEFLTSAITDYALTGKVDLNKALTQGVVGGFVAGKTTGSIDAASNLSNSVSDVQQTFTQELNDAGLKSFDGSNNISSLVDSRTNTFVAPEDVTSTLTNAGLIDTSNIDLSPAMQYAAANNTSQQQVYDAINGWLAANPEASQTEIMTAMSNAGVDIGDVVAAMSSKVTATNIANTANAATTGSTTGTTTGSTTGATTGSTTGTTTGTTGSTTGATTGTTTGATTGTTTGATTGSTTGATTGATTGTTTGTAGSTTTGTGSTGTVVATDASTNTALVVNSTGNTQVVNTTGNTGVGSTVTLTTDTASGTVTAAPVTSTVTGTTATTGATGATTGTTTGSNTGATVDVVTAQAIMADLGLNVSNATAVSLATQIAAANTGTTTGAATGTTTGANTTTATNAATTANTAANTSVDAKAAANAALAAVTGSNIATNTATNTTTAANTNAATNTAANTATNTAANTNATTAANTNAATNAATATNTNAATNANTNATTAANTNAATNATTAANTNAATNTATNTNANTNANVNANTNANVNANTNANTNANVNTNTNVNTNPNVNTNTNVNPNVNPNVNTNPNVNINTNVNTDLPNVLTVGGTSIPGSYVEPPVISTPITTTPSITEVTSTPTVTPATTTTTPTTTPPTVTKQPPKKQTKKQTPDQPQMPQQGGGIAELAPLANVFYYGKEFGGQKQQLSPTGELMMAPYQELSVTKAGAEAPVQAMSVAQAPKEDENDISALIQQIMAASGNNMTQEELMQIIQSRG